MSEVPTLQHITQVHLVTQLDDVVDQYEVLPEADVRGIVSKTLDSVQSKFYLVPKSKVLEDGNIASRELPEDAIEDQISKLWNNVSN